MGDMKFDYRKLRGRIREKFNTDKDFAETMGIRPSMVSQRLKGTREFKHKDIFMWAKTLEIPDSELADYFFTKAVKK